MLMLRFVFEHRRIHLTLVLSNTEHCITLYHMLMNTNIEKITSLIAVDNATYSASMVEHAILGKVKFQRFYH